MNKTLTQWLNRLALLSLLTILPFLGAYADVPTSCPAFTSAAGCLDYVTDTLGEDCHNLGLISGGSFVGGHCDKIYMIDGKRARVPNFNREATSISCYSIITGVCEGKKLVNKPGDGEDSTIVATGEMAMEGSASASSTCADFTTNGACFTYVTEHFSKSREKCYDVSLSGSFIQAFCRNTNSNTTQQTFISCYDVLVGTCEGKVLMNENGRGFLKMVTPSS